MSSDPIQSSHLAPSLNPYAPPQSVAAPPIEPDEDSWVDASKSARAVNFVVDCMFRAILLGVLGVLSPLGFGGSLARQLALDFAYCASLEFLFGATLGKLVTGTRVVALDGSKASFGAVIVRTLARWVPFEALSFVFAGRPARGWHDTMSRTRVVYARR